MPCLRHRSSTFAPASASFRTAMICSSLNRFFFTSASTFSGGLYLGTVLFQGSTSDQLSGERTELKARPKLEAGKFARRGNGPDWSGPVTTAGGAQATDYNAQRSLADITGTRT